MKILRDKLLELEDVKIDEYAKQLCFAANYGRQERVMRTDLLTGVPNRVNRCLVVEGIQGSAIKMLTACQ